MQPTSLAHERKQTNALQHSLRPHASVRAILRDRITKFSCPIRPCQLGFFSLSVNQSASAEHHLNGWLIAVHASHHERMQAKTLQALERIAVDFDHYAAPFIFI